MSDPKEFQDDASTVSGCTGACCDPVVMEALQYEDMSRNPKGHPNGRYVLNMLSGRRRSDRAPGLLEFDCKYFDRETRLCTAYDRRPKMCRTYPDEGECYLCGAKVGPAVPDTDEHAHEKAARMRVLQALVSQGREPERSSQRAPSSNGS